MHQMTVRCRLGVTLAVSLLTSCRGGGTTALTDVVVVVVNSGTDSVGFYLASHGAGIATDFDRNPFPANTFLGFTEFGLLGPNEHRDVPMSAIDES
jgi:hypothetical protein